VGNRCYGMTRDGIGKHVPVARQLQQLDYYNGNVGVFYVLRAPPCGGGVEYKTRVEAGSNTSTVTLRVVGGDEKGSLKTETIK
jgi:hypothetical protein